MRILSSLIVGALCAVGLLQVSPYLLILLSQIPLSLLPVLSGRFVKTALMLYVVIVFFGGWIATSVYAMYHAPNVATIWFRGCLIGTIIWFAYAFLNLYSLLQSVYGVSSESFLGLTPLTEPFLVAIALLVTTFIARHQATASLASPPPPNDSEQGAGP